VTPQQLDDIRTYLAALERACADLGPGRCDELVAEVRAHIDSVLADGGNVTDAQLHALLDSLGSPADIAAAARADDAPAPVRTTAASGFAVRDIAAIVLLLIGGFLAGIGWVVGAVLLWTSPSWRTRDKLIGTFVVPGGLLGSVMFAGLGSVAATQSCTSGAAGHTQCTGYALPTYVGVPLLIAVVLGPVFSAIWLVRTHRPVHPIAREPHVTARFS
jgi:hypothetical protein